MSSFLSSKLVRVFAVLFLFAFTSFPTQRAAAASADARMFGPWVVAESSSRDNVGLRVYFSPDGNFFLIDPKTQLGMNGTWVIGRAGLLVTIYGSGKWAKLWDADVSFASNEQMIIDVKESQFAPIDRITLQRLKY